MRSGGAPTNEADRRRQEPKLNLKALEEAAMASDWTDHFKAGVLAVARRQRTLNRFSLQTAEQWIQFAERDM